MVVSVDVKNGKLEEALEKHMDASKNLNDLGPTYIQNLSADHYSSIGQIYKAQGEKALDSGYRSKAMIKFKQQNVTINKL